MGLCSLPRLFLRKMIWINVFKFVKTPSGEWHLAYQYAHEISTTTKSSGELDTSASYPENYAGDEEGTKPFIPIGSVAPVAKKSSTKKIVKK